MRHDAETVTIASKTVTVHRYHTVIVGAGAAGMNCAAHVVEFLCRCGVGDAADRVVVITRGLGLGASRMSGSDKQTYYKLGTSAERPDCAAHFAGALTAGGCCHEDLALVEGICSLREFHHLVRAGVPFPRDAMGSYVGYRTDNDPAERATSAGPKTSRLMSECLQAEVQAAGVAIHDRQDVAALLTAERGRTPRIVGVATLEGRRRGDDFALGVYLCENLVLAAGGPGELYAASVYPPGQIGLHGLALRAGLAAENLAEWQFGLASVKHRWNLSGSYMQAVPRFFSADADGGNQRDFLDDAFSDAAQQAGAIFLKGYEWPFESLRVENHQSSLIDLLVHQETSRGRGVFLDFRSNPAARQGAGSLAVNKLPAEAADYLVAAGAVQATPIERLAHMNPLAVDLYREHGIDLAAEPLEIALCAQHNNGGLAVNTWWESNVPHTFVIGEMAGTHGVRRPGGAALNAGQVGGLRAAEYVARVYGDSASAGVGPAGEDALAEVGSQVSELIERLAGYGKPGGRQPRAVLSEIQHRMTGAGGHLRRADRASGALAEAVALYQSIRQDGLAVGEPDELPLAVQAEHMALASVAYLKGVVELLNRGGGSRGSYLVVDETGLEAHPTVLDSDTARPLRFAPENGSLREEILRLTYDPALPHLFSVEAVPPRRALLSRQAFELAWRDFRAGQIYRQ